MTIRVGTSHFVCKAAALQYYSPYFAEEHEVREHVKQLLEDGSISLGKPTLKEGEVCSLIPGEGRYQIHSDK